MSTQDFLAKSAFDDLANSIEQALSDTEGFRDEAENFADLARRGIRLVPPGVVANLSSFPANPEGGDAVLVESEDQIYFFDSDSSTWKDSKIIGSAIFANIQGDPSDNTALQTALDGKADVETGTFTPFYEPQSGAFNSLTYGALRSGNYIKLSKFVQWTLLISTTDTIDFGTASGELFISGLPHSDHFSATASKGAMSGWDIDPAVKSGDLDVAVIGGRMRLTNQDPNSQTGTAYIGVSDLLEVAGSSNRNVLRVSGSYIIN